MGFARRWYCRWRSATPAFGTASVLAVRADSFTERNIQLAQAVVELAAIGMYQASRAQQGWLGPRARLSPSEFDEIDQRSAALTVTGARGSGHESYR
ncbi:hypothetical protein [Actinopolymorpha singaporensis]|uniref:hypothetical protein n=1 Tax=Actinopolymorpha singaporensis TaxID=117157 RepID=UPI0012FD4B9E|nr:hypothetical protein [Actinopolymorpha singaporensis]